MAGCILGHMHGHELAGAMHAWNDRSRALALTYRSAAQDVLWVRGSRWGGYTHASDAPEWIGVDENVRDEDEQNNAVSVCMDGSLL